MKKKVTIDEAVYAAISLALHELADEVHDVESNVLTITHETFSYSPWSSKAFSMRQPYNVKK
jgi:hypothetical protein